jgi:nucleoside-diphosphate-sugar epimerase
MKLLVTGSSGYLGKHAVREALARGHEVTGLDLAPSGIAARGFREIIGDITDAETARRAAAGADAVFHCAAALAQFVRDENRMNTINVGGTRNVLEAAAAAGVKKLVFISSVEVYGIDVPVPCPEDAPMNPVCQYGRDKAECERLCAAYRGKGIGITVLRPPTINGPGQNEPFLVAQMGAIREGKPTLLPGGGKSRLQMVHVDDLVRAMFMALESPAADGLVCNIASDDVPTLLELTGALYAHAGTRPRFIRIPAGIARAAVKTLSLLGISPLEPQHLEIALRDYMFDNIRAKKVLGWRPLKNDIEAAVDAYDWFVKSAVES